VTTITPAINILEPELRRLIMVGEGYGTDWDGEEEGEE